MKPSPYRKLALSLAISFVVMYCVMFLNITDISYFYVSGTRLYMTLLMVCPMAIIMLLVMGQMYKDKRRNALIVTTAVVGFFLALTGLRTQTIITDVQYMKAMIPHHSSAILTSSNAHISDSGVRRLADAIIEAQKKEIAEMKEMISRLEN